MRRKQPAFTRSAGWIVHTISNYDPSFVIVVTHLRNLEMILLCARFTFMSLTLGGLTPAARQSGLYVHVDDFGFHRCGVSEPREPVQPTICRMVIFYRTDTFRVPTLKKT